MYIYIYIYMGKRPTAAVALLGRLLSLCSDCLVVWLHGLVWFRILCQLDRLKTESLFYKGFGGFGEKKETNNCDAGVCFSYRPMNYHLYIKGNNIKW